MTLHAAGDALVGLLLRLVEKLAAEKRRNRTTSSTTMSGAPTNSASVNCQPRNTSMMMLSSRTRLVEAISKAIAAVKSRALAEERAGQRHRGVGARRRCRAERERSRDRCAAGHPAAAGHLAMRDDRLHDAPIARSRGSAARGFPIPWRTPCRARARSIQSSAAPVLHVRYNARRTEGSVISISLRSSC